MRIFKKVFGRVNFKLSDHDRERFISRCLWVSSSRIDMQEHGVFDSLRKLETGVNSLGQLTVNNYFNDLKAQDGGKLLAIANIGVSPVQELSNHEYLRYLETSLKSWLHPVDYELDLQTHLDRLSESSDGSATWIFTQDKFAQWNSGARDTRVLWIAGKPGVGKTIIAASILQKLKDTTPGFVGYAFGSRRDEYRSQTSTLIKSVLWQMLNEETLNIEQKRQMVEVYQRHVPDATTSSQAQTSGFDKVLQEYVKIQGNVTLVLDGLDECSVPQDFIKRILNMASDTKCDLRVLFVSQKTPDIVKVLAPKSLLIDMDSDIIKKLTDSDIKHFVKSELQKKSRIESDLLIDELNLGELDISEGETRESTVSEIIQQNMDSLASEICTKANGMFLWAVMAIPDVISRLSHMDYDTLLKSIGRLPGEMDDMFLYLLNRATANDYNLGTMESHKRRRYLLIMLRWVFHAVRPLSLKELQIAISLDPKLNLELEISTGELPKQTFLTELTRAAYPLIVIQDQKLTVLHSSFRDLVHPLPGQEDMRIATILGSVSLLEGFIQLCIHHLASDRFRLESCLNQTKASLSSAHPFYDYACTAWVSHLEVLEKPSKSLQDAIAGFLQGNTVATWLEQRIYLGLGKLTTLQSSIFAAVDAVTDPSWILKPLERCCQLRKEQDETSFATLQMRRELGRMFQHVGKLDASMKEFQEILRHRSHTFPAKQDDFALLVESDIGWLHGLRGDHELSVRTFSSLVEACKKSKGELDSFTLINQHYLGRALDYVGRVAEAEAILREVFEKQKRVFGETDSCTLNTLNRLVMTLNGQAKFKEAEFLAYEQERIALQTRSKMGYEALLASSNVAFALSGLGQHAAALKRRQDVWEVCKARLGPTNPDTLTSKTNMGCSLDFLGKHEEALQAAREVFEDSKKVYGESHIQTLTAANNFAVRLETSGKRSEAIVILEKILELRTRILGTNHRDTLLIMSNLAWKYDEVNRWNEAKELTRRACAGHFQVLRESHPQTVDGLHLAAAVATRHGFIILQAWLCRRALEMAQLTSFEGHPEYIRALRQRADAEVVCGNLDLAIKLAKEATNKATIYLGDSREETMACRRMWAFCMQESGLYDESEELLQDIRQRRLNNEMSKAFLLDQSLLAWTHVLQDRLDLAIEELRSIRDLAPNYFPSGNIFITTVDISLATALTRCGLSKEAEELGRSALAARMKLYGEHHGRTAAAMECLAGSLQGELGLTEARGLLMQAVNIRRSLTSIHHPKTLNAMADLSQVLEHQGFPGDAASLMQIVVNRREEILRPKHPSILSSKARLGQMLRDLGEEPAIKESDIQQLLKSETPSDPEALRILAQSREFFGDTHPLALQAQFELGQYYASTGMAPEAEQCFTAVLDICLEKYGNESHLLLRTMVQLGRLRSGSLTKAKWSQCVHRAIMFGDLDLLRGLLDAGADPNEKDAETQLSALGQAAKLRNPGFAKELLQRGADANCREQSGETALHIAVANKSLELVALLLEHNASPYVADARKRSALLDASLLKDGDALLKAILSHGALPEKDESIIPALHRAANDGSMATLKLLIGMSKDIDVRQEHGYTPFLAAANGGAVPAMEALLEAGADLQAFTAEGSNALHVACLGGDAAAVEFLLGKGVDPEQVRNNESGERPFHCAVRSGSVQCLEVLLRKGANPDALSARKMSPLAYAIHQKRPEAAHWFIKHHADVNDRLAYGTTALLWAANEDYPDLVEELLKAGADPDVMADGGITAMFHAVFNGNVDMVRSLLNHGAKQMVDGIFYPPLTYAVYKKYTEIVNMLLASSPEASLNYHEPATGVSVMGIACWLDDIATVDLLLSKGAPTHLANADGTTPLHVAVGNRNEQIVKALVTHNAQTNVYDRYGRRPIDWVTSDCPGISALLGWPAPQSQNNGPSLPGYSANKCILQAAADIGQKAGLEREAIAWVLGRTLLLVHDRENAVKALEIWHAPDTKSLSQECPLCQQSVKDHGYICPSCLAFNMCHSCGQKIIQGELKPTCCPHDPGDFLLLPRDGWKDWPIGVVDEAGTTIDEWAAALCRKYQEEEDVVAQNGEVKLGETSTMV